MKKPEYWQESIDYLSNIDAKLGELIKKEKSPNSV